jgi:hypothetical protein
MVYRTCYQECSEEYKFDSTLLSGIKSRGRRETDDYLDNELEMKEILPQCLQEHD